VGPMPPGTLSPSIPPPALIYLGLTVSSSWPALCTGLSDAAIAALQGPSIGPGAENAGHCWSAWAPHFWDAHPADTCRSSAIADYRRLGIAIPLGGLGRAPFKALVCGVPCLTPYISSSAGPTAVAGCRLFLGLLRSVRKFEAVRRRQYSSVRTCATPLLWCALIHP